MFRLESFHYGFPAMGSGGAAPMSPPDDPCPRPRYPGQSDCDGPAQVDDGLYRPPASERIPIPFQTPECSPLNSPPSLGSSYDSAKDLRRAGARKSSLVYDVRMKDEQFLFLVQDIDLVKSHLMHAVRGEVVVLKERIVELMDRISHLESENQFLRQCASPDTLQQLPPHSSARLPGPHHNSNT